MAMRRRYRGENGNFLLEFAMLAPFLVLLLAGTVDVGMALNRSILAGQVCRNANVLMVRGIDLSLSQNQQLVMRTAAGLGLNIPGTNTPNPSGRGVILLTKVLRVGPLECSIGIANWNGSPDTCPNYDKYVIANRITVGNGTSWQSKFGNPATTLKSNGDLYDADIAAGTSNVAQGFPAALALDLDQYTYISEIYVDTSTYQLFSAVSTPLIYMRNFS